MKIRRTLEKSIAVIFSIVFAVCSFFTLFHFEKYPLGFHHSTLKTLIFALVCAGILIGYVKLFDGRNTKRVNIARLSIAFLLIILQVLLFLKVMTPIGWDAFEITNSAEYGMYNGDYFIRHTNNLFMQILLSDYLKIMKFLPILSPLRKMELLNLLFVDVSILMAVMTARKLYGIKASDRVFICSVLLIGFHPTLSTIYSDTLAMPFPVGVLFFIVHAVHKAPTADAPCKQAYRIKVKKALCMFMAGVLGIFGYYIKPTVLIIYIAMGILLFLRWEKEKLPKQLLLLFVSFALGCGTAATVIYMREAPVKRTLEEQYPDIIPLGVLHYMGLGLSSLEDDPSGYGGWNKPEVRWTQQHIEDDDYAQEAMAHIGERISNYGPIGYPEHLFNKLVWAGSDGTFFYGLEGGFHLEEQAPSNTLRGLLQNGFYIETNFYQNWFSSFMQGVWLMICVMSALSIFRRSGSIYSSAAKLSVLGLFLFLLLFENRSRYLFLYLPLVLLALESETGWTTAFTRRISKSS